MKTQRPRDRVNQRQSSDGSRLADGSNGADDGATQGKGEGTVTARNTPPALPKRKAVPRPAQAPAPSKIAVADVEAPVASAEPQPVTPSQPKSSLPAATEPSVRRSVSSRVWTAF